MDLESEMVLQTGRIKDLYIKRGVNKKASNVAAGEWNVDPNFRSGK